MNLFGMIDQSGSAMQAERMRAEVVAANMANAETTRTSAGTPYHRQHVVFAAGRGDPEFANQLDASMAAPGQGPFSGFAPGLPTGSLAGGNIAPGVHIAAVVQDTAPPLKRYDPSHPDADAEGYVSYPDINPLTEMVDLMGATRAYGLNASAVQAEKSMISSALDISK
ncbi:flagellar basal body rod protein FlgC [Acidicapsa acidisoli]|uniref:flagellar basal body rod protein FlgC n=1 Tax=Acidicapsa acidisoli TaxID=1615681 RepID=UPI0021DF5FCC|nr:flagellar basal body rod protein FlgC [Acidicapsa acidisoli]